MFYGSQLLICMPRWSIGHALLQHAHTSDENLNTPWSCHSGTFPAHSSVREETGKGGRCGKGKQEADGDGEGPSDAKNMCHHGGLPWWLSGKKAARHAGELCSMLCGSLSGRGVWGRMDTCVYVAESPHLSAETGTALLIGSVHVLSCVWLLATPWTVAPQAPLSVGFSRQEYWSGLPCPPPGDLPNPEVEPRFPTWQVESLPYEPPGKPKNTGIGSLSLL